MLGSISAKALSSSFVAHIRLSVSSATGVIHPIQLIDLINLGILAVTIVLGATTAEAAEDKTCSLRPGRQTREIEAAGAMRTFHVSVGPGVSSVARAPVVFIWHGWGGSANGMLRIFDPARLWRDAIFVAPEGLPRRFPGLGSRSHRGWQIEGGEFEDRDLLLFDAILESLAQEGCIDSKRVTSTGFSNGGFFSNVLGCRRAAVVAAIAPVSSGGPQATSCGGPVPVLIVHGTLDPVVPYREGVRSFQRWGVENACREVPAATPASCVQASGCKADSSLCSFAGGHSWPRDAPQRVVDFLQAHVD